jgi:beta-lactamase class A
MTTGLVSKLLAGAALATAVLASAAPAHADSLQSEFDKAFSPPAAVTRSPLQAPAKAPPLKVQPSTESAQRVLPATVRPFVSGIAPRPYGSGLDAQLAAQADPSQGRIGVAAINLSTGQTTTVLGDTPFPMASTSKIAIAATFLAGVDDGRFSLDASYPLMVPVKSKKFSTTVAPVRKGPMMSGRQLIERALIYSDNAATDALLAVVGGPTAVNRWMRSTGNSGMRIDRDIATLVRDDGEYNPATMIDERDSATPLAMARMLSGLYQGRWLSGDSRAFLISTMERCQTGKRRMRALLPSDARIAHKTGTLSNTASDVGLVRTPDGQVYAIAVYVTGQGGHAGRDAKIAAISRTIYDGYSGESSSYRVAAQ